MTSRDSRYRSQAAVEHRRAERYRDLLLAVVVLALRGEDLREIDWAEHLDADDLAEVARRRKAAHTGHRTR